MTLPARPGTIRLGWRRKIWKVPFTTTVSGAADSYSVTAVRRDNLTFEWLQAQLERDEG